MYIIYIYIYISISISISIPNSLAIPISISVSISIPISISMALASPKRGNSKRGSRTPEIDACLPSSWVQAGFSGSPFRTGRAKAPLSRRAPSANPRSSHPSTPRTCARPPSTACIDPQESQGLSPHRPRSCPGRVGRAPASRHRLNGDLVLQGNIQVLHNLSTSYNCLQEKD